MARTAAWVALGVALGAGGLQMGLAARSSSEHAPSRGERQAGGSRSQRLAPTASQPALAPPAPLRRAARGGGEPLRYVAVGGGAFPESNEVSLEQNLELAQSVLAGPGALAFAGGQGSEGVRLLADDDGRDLRVRLGDVFAPRPGRHSRYRPTQLAAEPADRASVERLLGEALASGDRPLLLYVTTHGDQGERPRDSTLALWGGETLTAEQLARLHDAYTRPLVAVVASCFSGGFGELAFQAGDEAAGPSRAPRCGLFAGTWDRETSGCDPDPDRARQEGYSLHLLNALRGRDRSGRVLPLGDLDADRDGRVSLLEAHAWAAMTGQSFDVPTTTSERFLRAVQRRRGVPARSLLPEHAAVVDRLSASLGLSTEAQASVRFAHLEGRLKTLDDQLDVADAAADAAYRALAARLLARWPVLDDAYHPGFGTTLERDGAAIEAALDGWPEAARLTEAEAAVDRLERTREPLEVEAAVALRLLRAHETLGLAGGLLARGGSALSHLEGLLACERFVPALRSPDDAARAPR